MRIPHALKNTLGLAALCTGLTALPLAALAADAGAEITTAATHAGFSAAATSIDMAHTHLKHTLNCLVGPGGNGFDKTALNPCVNSGNGAIPDTADAAKKTSLEDVAAKTRAALMNNDLAAVQKDAAAIETALKAMK